MTSARPRVAAAAVGVAVATLSLTTLAGCGSSASEPDTSDFVPDGSAVLDDGPADGPSLTSLPDPDMTAAPNPDAGGGAPSATSEP